VCQAVDVADIAMATHSFALFYSATMRQTLAAALRKTTDWDIAHRATQHAYAIMLGQWHDLRSEPCAQNARHVRALTNRTLAALDRDPDGDLMFWPAQGREHLLDDVAEPPSAYLRDGLHELAAAAWPPQPPGAGTRFSAFVAGSDPGSRTAITGWLSRMGADPVYEATTAEEVLAHTCVSGPCHLALLDLDLPHPDVLELVTDLRLRGWRRIVVLASPDDPTTASLALRAGAQACLLKPAPGNAPPRTSPDHTTPRTPDTAARHTATRPRHNPYHLSNREIEVLQLVAAGHSNKEIGEALNLSALTIRSHLMRTGRKLGAGNRAQMVAHAMRARIIH
jgi:DNA-binding NarL/FixJ family response regulator